jgi:hypothetical protein
LSRISPHSFTSCKILANRIFSNSSTNRVQETNGMIG